MKYLFYLSIFFFIGCVTVKEYVVSKLTYYEIDTILNNQFETNNILINNNLPLNKDKWIHNPIFTPKGVKNQYTFLIDSLDRDIIYILTTINGDTTSLLKKIKQK